MQARVESELQQLDESEESKEFESEELKLKLVPGDLGLGDLELVLEALEGLEGLELKRLIADPRKHGKQQPLWGQAPQKWQTVATLGPDPTKHWQIPTSAHGEARCPASP